MKEWGLRRLREEGGVGSAGGGEFVGGMEGLDPSGEQCSYEEFVDAENATFLIAVTCKTRQHKFSKVPCTVKHDNNVIVDKVIEGLWSKRMK